MMTCDDRGCLVVVVERQYNDYIYIYCIHSNIITLIQAPGPRCTNARLKVKKNSGEVF